VLRVLLTSLLDSGQWQHPGDDVSAGHCAPNADSVCLSMPVRIQHLTRRSAIFVRGDFVRVVFGAFRQAAATVGDEAAASFAGLPSDPSRRPIRKRGVPLAATLRRCRVM
jgi:hypothetical protein